MKNTVIIKGNRYGISIVFDKDMLGMQRNEHPVSGPIE